MKVPSQYGRQSSESGDEGVHRNILLEVCFKRLSIRALDPPPQYLANIEDLTSGPEVLSRAFRYPKKLREASRYHPCKLELR